MRLTDLPDENDPAAIFKFAMSFDGYQHFGSFEASAEAAASGDRSTLDLIRNELFFTARASRHGDEHELLDVYREVLPILQAFRSSPGDAARPHDHCCQKASLSASCSKAKSLPDG